MVDPDIKAAWQVRIDTAANLGIDTVDYPSTRRGGVFMSILTLVLLILLILILIGYVAR